jgi:hypothetical protein
MAKLAVAMILQTYYTVEKKNMVGGKIKFSR